MFLRPITMQDLDALTALAEQTGIGMTTLPADRAVLEEKVRHAELSFSDAIACPEDGYYLMALEDPESGALMGTTAVIASIGRAQPFYSYKLHGITQSCRELGIMIRHDVLHLVNDYTGASELATLFVAPGCRGGGWGKMLSLARFLLIAEFPHRFSDMIIAELRGMQDAQDKSPFWRHLGKHFFGMHFQKADFLNATMGNEFIADLMPKYPVYVSLLPEEAQSVIGKPFRDSEPAMRMLERQGFRYEGYIDIFDGGPTIQARRDDIHTIRQSRRVTVGRIGEPEDNTAPQLLSTTKLRDFRVTRGVAALDDHMEAVISPRLAAWLQVDIGDDIRLAPF